jgi:hypothetical protein
MQKDVGASQTAVHHTISFRKLTSVFFVVQNFNAVCVLFRVFQSYVYLVFTSDLN